MTITRDHLIFDILEIVRAGGVVDDEMLTPEQIGFWIDNTRALLVERDVSRGRAPNVELVQTLPCENVIQVDASECGCTQTGCYVLRTTNQIPAFLDVRGLPLVTRIASPDITSIAFSFMSHERAIWSGSNRFTDKIVKAFIRNGYVYFLTKRFFKKVSISGVFSSPLSLGEFSTCTGTPCYDTTSKYPVNASLIEEIKVTIAKTNLGLVLSNSADNVNNANGDLPPRQSSRE